MWEFKDVLKRVESSNVVELKIHPFSCLVISFHLRSDLCKIPFHLASSKHSTPSIMHTHNVATKNIFKSQLTHSWFDSQVSKQRERLRKAFLRSKHLCRILYVFFAWIENLLSCSGRSKSYSLCFCSATLIFFTCSSSTLSSNWAWWISYWIRWFVFSFKTFSLQLRLHSDSSWRFQMPWKDSTMNPSRMFRHKAAKSFFLVKCFPSHPIDFKSLTTRVPLVGFKMIHPEKKLPLFLKYSRYILNNIHIYIEMCSLFFVYCECTHKEGKSP